MNVVSEVAKLVEHFIISNLGHNVRNISGTYTSFPTIMSARLGRKFKAYKRPLNLEEDNISARRILRHSRLEFLRNSEVC